MTDFKSMQRKNMKMLVEIQKEVLLLFEKMIKFAKVLIITNAKEGWVDLSSFYFLPRLHKLIETYVPVVSAQQEFMSHFPIDPSKWKE